MVDVPLRLNNEKTTGEFRKCSIRTEGSSTKSVAQRVPETFWYFVQTNVAINLIRLTFGGNAQGLTVHSVSHLVEQGLNYAPFKKSRTVIYRWYRKFTQ